MDMVQETLPFYRLEWLLLALVTCYYYYGSVVETIQGCSNHTERLWVYHGSFIYDNQVKAVECVIDIHAVPRVNWYVKRSMKGLALQIWTKD